MSHNKLSKQSAQVQSVIPKKHMEQLKKWAEKENRSVSNLVAKIIADAINK